MTDLPAPEPLSVAPSTDVGSERLAAALAAADVPGIGRALRHDYVIVPLMRGAEGETQTRVIAADDPEGERRWELCLFSSTQAFSDFLAGDAQREFAIRSGASLTPMLEQYRTLLRRVVFDPAGPHPVRASVEDVLATLEATESDDAVAWITSPDGRPEFGLRPGERVVGLDLMLGDDWATIDLGDPERLKKDVAALVKAQLRGIPQAPVLRGQLTSWLTTTGRRAAAAGGRSLAFLTRRTETAAAAVSVAQFWQDLGVEGPHLDDQAARLSSNLEGAELVRAETAAGPFLRHTRRTMGPPELGGPPVFVIDYWLEFPDRRGLCLVSFSTPHGDALDAIRRLADNVVLAASWELAPGAEASGR
ncbi:hypothetical protein [Microbacterium ulmi]|uniref:Uncharacterized protein n=1 Tax=Microbacterium ulmi TaxID=179095 RepID=A0A7Y2M445_9MICO|nr:hypothetical protein [Microbacterium ulmi]NII68826.1 hypothetical protein [Microbacterium ulmi]NNH04743.1 hypothetical protein [Microbacterium ulmi]